MALAEKKVQKSQIFSFRRRAKDQGADQKTPDDQQELEKLKRKLDRELQDKKLELLEVRNVARYFAESAF